MTGSTILLWHGFMRSPRNLASMIGMLRSANFAVVAPHARGPVAMNRPSTARSAVARLSATQGLQALQSHDSPSAVVIVTHSAGAALGAWSALALPPTVVRGLVFADGTDNLVRGACQSLPMLRGVPIHLVDADPCPCNRYGALSRVVRANHDVVRYIRVPGAGHGDIERDVSGVRPPARSGPSALYARICGDRSSDAIAAQFQAAVLAAVLDLAK